MQVCVFFTHLWHAALSLKHAQNIFNPGEAGYALEPQQQTDIAGVYLRTV